MAECRSCHARVHWLKTKNGKRMCVNSPMPAGASDTLFDHQVHTAHFATCPESEKHRKAKATPPSDREVPPEYLDWAAEMRRTGHLSDEGSEG